MFIDRAKILIRSGDGGSGCISFRREKYVPKGGPNGGDGGKGGDIIFIADAQLSTLIDLQQKTHYRAQRGEHGKGSNKTGRNGADIIITVPPGTIIKDAESNEILAELLSNGEEKVVLKGGRGGKGNPFFKTATNQAPRVAQPGEKGEERTVLIELKLIADAGLVGFPNAGKSTLISKISSAKPKIADYPFTTLIPNLGIVKYKEYNSFVVADIPGIIEGASSGKGLGYQFLRHIERTRLLLFLLDSTKLSEIEDPLSDYEILINELSKYEADLTDKPRIICFTKIDAVDEIVRSRIDSLEIYEKIICISSITGENLEELKDIVWTKLQELKENE